MSDEHKSDSNTIPELQVPVARSSRYQEVYANGVRLRVTPIDFTMTLGTSPDIPGGPLNIIQDEVSVTLTHSFLKVLARNLSAVVQAIEEELGPIKIPERNIPQKERIAAMSQALRDAKLVE
jgi:hypothetical protein